MKAVTAVAIADDAEVEEVPLGLASSSFLAGVEDGSTGSVRGDDKLHRRCHPIPTKSMPIRAWKCSLKEYLYVVPRHKPISKMDFDT